MPDSKNRQEPYKRARSVRQLTINLQPKRKKASHMELNYGPDYLPVISSERLLMPRYRENNDKSLDHRGKERERGNRSDGLIRDLDQRRLLAIAQVLSRGRIPPVLCASHRTDGILHENKEPGPIRSLRDG